MELKRPSDDFESFKRFNDGGQYRFEVPGIQSPKIMDTLLKEASKNEITIHRITQTKGIMLLTDEEITEMVNLAKKYECELFYLLVQELLMIQVQLPILKKEAESDID